MDQPKTIEFKLEGGDDIRPEAFRSREVATIILSLEEAVRAIAVSQFPGMDPDKLYISLVQIKNESNGFGFVPSLAELVTSFLLLAQSVGAESYEQIPARAIESLKEIQKIVKQRPNCVGTFIIDSERVSQLTAKTVVQQSSYDLIKGETTLYGIIQRVGGATPRMVLRQFNGEVLSIEVTEEIAREVGSKLYTSVGLVGIAKWAPSENKIIDFLVKSILPQPEASIVSSFSSLRNEIGKYWDEVENIEQLLSID